LAIYPACDVAGDAARRFGDDHGLCSSSKTAVTSPAFVDLVGNVTGKQWIGMKAVKDESRSTDFENLRQVLGLERARASRRRTIIAIQWLHERLNAIDQLEIGSLKRVDRCEIPGIYASGEVLNTELATLIDD
jgi:hypothetical protein